MTHKVGRDKLNNGDQAVESRKSRRVNLLYADKETLDLQILPDISIFTNHGRTKSHKFLEIALRNGPANFFHSLETCQRLSQWVGWRSLAKENVVNFANKCSSVAGGNPWSYIQ